MRIGSDSQIRWREPTVPKHQQPTRLLGPKTPLRTCPQRTSPTKDSHINTHTDSHTTTTNTWTKLLLTKRRLVFYFLSITRNPPSGFIVMVRGSHGNITEVEEGGGGEKHGGEDEATEEGRRKGKQN
ncbi:hypothetical protein Salat_1968000 [Sesamum alatum]|uniref:Uncharacterized protein n=1 Tax=Sesamum alatum TaxID=300844 RepID=A0AAE1Y4Y4_9LAMI|nr:hypothetical protein Salat_1968000 [Sesamum alatum]